MELLSQIPFRKVQYQFSLGELFDFKGLQTFTPINLNREAAERIKDASFFKIC